MASLPLVRPGYGARWSRFAAARPEAWVYAVSALCWALLIGGPRGSAATAFCLGDPGRLDSLSFAAGATLAAFDWPFALRHWLVMTGAMMLPMTAMALRHVAFRSFRRRRMRAMAGFLAGYVLLWAAIAPLYLLAGLGARIVTGGLILPALGAALVLAAAWQSTATKRLALRQCHRKVPLTPSGWRADRDCVVFGLAHGRACVTSCWALMLIPVAAGHPPALMLLVSLVALCERQRPAAEPIRGPVPLAAAVAALCRPLRPIARAAIRLR
jgi:predicted metal-binding membrane protein